MENRPSPLGFLKSKAALLVTAALAAHGFLLFAVARPEFQPLVPPLSSFPTVFGSWSLVQEGYVDDDTRAVLKADDLLTRTYAKADERVPLNLFIAAFLSQRQGKSPHSPKNCLPGAGWVQDQSGTIGVEVPRFGTIEVNRYVVSKGDARSVVIYWYQSRNRIVANEFKAKVWVVADSMRYNRTDTALIRVVCPVINKDDDAATKLATGFIADVFPLLQRALPQ